MLQALDHVVVAVSDLDASADRTSRLLGRPASWRGNHPGAGTANALFRLENAYLELLAPSGEGDVGRAIAGLLEARGEGVAALAFGSDDVAAFARDVRDRGVAVADPEPGEAHAEPPADTDGAPALRRWSRLPLPLAATRGLPLFAIEHHSPADSLPLRATRGDANAAVAAFDHVVVISDDPGASRGVYGELLGLRLALDREFEQRGIRICFFRVGGVTVEVAGPLEPAADAGATDRFGGIAYQVGDAGAARARLLAEGFDVSDTRPGHKPGTRVCTLRDGTCGVPTLLIEAAAPRG